MKRILLATAAVAFLGSGAANACLVDSNGENVLDSDGSTIATSIGPCTVVVDSNVAFLQGSSELTAMGRATLDRVNKANVTKITGYASEEGEAGFNQALSLARAQAVANYLGLTNVEVVGAGETTQFGEQLAANRVVVIN